MRTKAASQRRVRAALIATVMAAGGLAGVASAGPAVADPASLDLNYTCPFPLIGDQPLKVKISSDVPASVPVGEPTPELKIDTVATVSADATSGLNLVGAKTVEGSAEAASTVTAPEGSTDVKVPFEIPETPVPASGTFDISTSGNAAPLTFTQPGTAKIGIGDLSLTLTPRNANGDETALGTFDSACKQDQGQDNVLAELQITGGTAAHAGSRAADRSAH